MAHIGVYTQGGYLPTGVYHREATYPPVYTTGCTSGWYMSSVYLRVVYEQGVP